MKAKKLIYLVDGGFLNSFIFKKIDYHPLRVEIDEKEIRLTNFTSIRASPKPLLHIQEDGISGFGMVTVGKKITFEKTMKEINEKIKEIPLKNIKLEEEEKNEGLIFHDIKLREKLDSCQQLSSDVNFCKNPLIIPSELKSSQLLYCSDSMKAQILDGLEESITYNKLIIKNAENLGIPKKIVMNHIEFLERLENKKQILSESDYTFEEYSQTEQNIIYSTEINRLKCINKILSDPSKTFKDVLEYIANEKGVDYNSLKTNSELTFRHLLKAKEKGKIEMDFKKESEKRKMHLEKKLLENKNLNDSLEDL